MPSPFTPPFVTIVQDLITEVQTQTAAIQNLEAQVAAQADDIDKLANLARYQAESFYGANLNITGIWDGTDRYGSV